jgi:hypothetical protein
MFFLSEFGTFKAIKMIEMSAITLLRFYIRILRPFRLMYALFNLLLSSTEVVDCLNLNVKFNPVVGNKQSI